MKYSQSVRLILLSALAIAAGTFAPSDSLAQQEALRVELTYKDNRKQVGIIINANNDVISFALQEGAAAQNVPYSELAAINFPDGAQITQAARKAYLSADLENAATAMEQIADAYPQAAYVPDNFATEARFYQMDSLRRLGRYSELGKLFGTNTGKAMESALDEVFVRQVALLKLWAYYGANNIEQLGTELEAYLKPVVGDDKMLPDQLFLDDLPESDLVQLSFLRAKVHEAAGRNSQALEDYYRAFTLTQANQSNIAREAMVGAMKIHAADPEINAKESKKWPLQSVAYTFKTAFSHGDIDSAFADYAVMPELPVTQPAPQEAGDAPAAADGDAAKADAVKEPAADAKADDDAAPAKVAE